jgi:hypothetical protein
MTLSRKHTLTRLELLRTEWAERDGVCDRSAKVPRGLRRRPTRRARRGLPVTALIPENQMNAYSGAPGTGATSSFGLVKQVEAGEPSYSALQAALR